MFSSETSGLFFATNAPFGYIPSHTRGAVVSTTRRRHPVAWIFGTIVLVAAVILGIQFHNSTGVFAGKRPPTTSVPASQPKDIGEHVTVSGTAVPTALKATKATNAIAPPFKNYKAPTKPWHILSITPSGKLKAPMAITLPLDHKAGKNDLVLVAVNHKHTADGWTYVGGTISPDKQHITITVTELSWFAPFWSDLVGMVNELKEQFIDGMTSGVFADAKKPECQNESAARADDYKISSDNKDTIYWCFGVENGKRVLKVVNHRHYPLEIKRSGLTTVSRGLADLDLAQLANLGDHLILNAGDTAVFSLNLKNHGDKATVNTDVSSLALGLHAVDVLATTIVSILFKVNPHMAGNAADFIKYALHSRDCVSALGDITNIGNFIKECFDGDLLKEAFNWQAALLAPVMSAFAILGLGRSVISALSDSGNGKAKYNVTVTRPKPNPFASFILPGGNEWHVHGFDMLIKDDGTASATWNGGPCDNTSLDNIQMCVGHSTYSLVPDGNGKLRGTVKSLWYTTDDGSRYDAYDTSSDRPVGATFTLSHGKDSHLLNWVWSNSKYNSSSMALCDPYASARNDTPYYGSKCGA